MVTRVHAPGVGSLHPPEYLASNRLADYRFGGDIDGHAEGEVYSPGTPILTVTGTFATLVQDTPGGIGNRSVTFTDSNVSFAGAASLTSQSVAVTFSLNGDHTVLTGTADLYATAFSRRRNALFGLLFRFPRTHRRQSQMRDSRANFWGQNPAVFCDQRDAFMARST